MGSIYTLVFASPPPTHARDRTRIPSTSCLTAWPIIINHRFPILDRTSSSVPTLPFVCLSITLPEASLFNLTLADIRDARDAHIILEAVRLNILPLITRRLSSTEREQLGSGNVFVWEEAEFKGGLERWTDGRRWKVTLAHGGRSAVGLTFSI
jgi:Gti1/Pac2 family